MRRFLLPLSFLALPLLAQSPAEAAAVDPQNTLLWRMNPRRMDIESYRDSLLRAAGRLSEEMYGPSEEVDAPGNNRRTV